MGPKYPNLFSPYRIRNVLFKNRIISAPLGAWVFSPDNFIFDYAVSMFEEKARGGAAVVTVGHTEVNNGEEDGDGVGLYFNLRGNKGIAALTEFASAVQQYGAVASVELNYGGVYMPDHRGVCYGPSGYVSQTGKEIREMSREKIKQVLGMYAECTAKLRRCGFKMVTVHGAHGWLPAQFLSKKTNRRGDEYGGSLENRMRFALELVRAVRGAAGKDMVVEYRISGIDPRYRPEDFEEIAAMLTAMEADVDLVHVSSGDGHTDEEKAAMHTFPTYLDGRGTNLRLAAPLKQRLKTPVAVVGAISDPAMAERIISDGTADFVAMCRALIADPELPDKARRGLEGDIRPCIACYNCLENMHKTHFLGCDVNPRTGREHRVAAVSPAPAPKRVAVVGGGPAGMQAAITARGRGHEVILFEKTDTLGGLLKITDHNKIKWMLNDYKEYLIRQLLKSGAEIRLNAEATPELLSGLGFDAMIVAAGSRPVVPSIPGVDGRNVFDCLRAHAESDKLGKRAVVVGGNMVGCETAMYLRSIGVPEVTVVEMTGKIHADASMMISDSLDTHLADWGVKFITDAKCTAIGPESVTLSLAGGSVRELPADSVVLAVGMRGEYGVFERMLSCAPDVVPVGDCTGAATVQKASRTGFFAARNI